MWLCGELTKDIRITLSTLYSILIGNTCRHDWRFLATNENHLGNQATVKLHTDASIQLIYTISYMEHRAQRSQFSKRSAFVDVPKLEKGSFEK